MAALAAYSPMQGTLHDLCACAALQAGQLGLEKRSLAWAVSSQLAGVRNVTISAPGVLLQEWTPRDLQAWALPPTQAPANLAPHTCQPWLPLMWCLAMAQSHAPVHSNDGS
jgi:hypothetical protein